MKTIFKIPLYTFELVWPVNMLVHIVATCQESACNNPLPNAADVKYAWGIQWHPCPDSAWKSTCTWHSEGCAHSQLALVWALVFAGLYQPSQPSSSLECFNERQPGLQTGPSPHFPSSHSIDVKFLILFAPRYLWLPSDSPIFPCRCYMIKKPDLPFHFGEGGLCFKS